MKKLLLLSVLALGAPVFAGDSFEAIALVDHLDFATHFDIETKKGILQCLEHVLLTHATDVWWRDKGGAKMRYPGGVEGWPLVEAPFDKLRLPCEDIWGHLRLDSERANSLPLVREECLKRGVRFGIHTTTEENHWSCNLASSWTMAHPEYWSCQRGGVPFMGCCSLGYREVFNHKLAMVDERLAFKPHTILLDTWRHGAWSSAREYTPVMCERWKAKYHCEPPEPKDQRWKEFVALYVKAYYRAFAAKCHAAGARFVLGIHAVDGGEDRWALDRCGCDWHELAADGTLDGVYVMNILVDPKDPMGSTERIYRAVMDRRGKADVYFPLTQYNFTGVGIPGYAKMMKVSEAEAAERLMRLARQVGGKGVIMEVVDYGNYTKAINDRIAKVLAE